MGNKIIEALNSYKWQMSDADAFSATYPGIAIQAGQSLSNAIDLGRDVLAGVIVPAAVEATTAQVSFLASDTLGGTYRTVKRNGVKVTVAISVNDFALLYAPSDLAGVRFVKIQLETIGGVAVAQTTAKTFLAIKVAML